MELHGKVQKKTNKFGTFLLSHFVGNDFDFTPGKRVKKKIDSVFPV